MDSPRQARTRRPSEVPALEAADVRFAAGGLDTILTRIRADDASAADARARFRTGRMDVIDPDTAIGPLLQPGECVLAVRRHVELDRRQLARDSAAAGLLGDFYVTSARVVFVGRVVLGLGLGEIEDAMVSGNRLLLVMQDGAGVSLDVAGPRLLRVEIAAARAAARMRTDLAEHAAAQDFSS